MIDIKYTVDYLNSSVKAIVQIPFGKEINSETDCEFIDYILHNGIDANKELEDTLPELVYDGKKILSGSSYCSNIKEYIDDYLKNIDFKIRYVDVGPVFLTNYKKEVVKTDNNVANLIGVSEKVIDKSVKLKNFNRLEPILSNLIIDVSYLQHKNIYLYTISFYKTINEDLSINYLWQLRYYSE